MNAFRHRRIARLEASIGITTPLPFEPLDMKIVLVAPDGTKSAPMRLTDHGLVEVEQEKKNS